VENLMVDESVPLERVKTLTGTELCWWLNEWVRRQAQDLMIWLDWVDVGEALNPLRIEFVDDEEDW
jgi:hypothetical protein